ncbi:hypothetical protein BKA70DRAFT_1414554 [Coprinopsis sp. MPI-PUGE-AT-0042]|nr:hypothetical protein BKA70DRAFT_1414554 [Coprinopsis sp. MPI-PUGE-AT-0042]
MNDQSVSGRAVDGNDDDDDDINKAGESKADLAEFVRAIMVVGIRRSIRHACAVGGSARSRGFYGFAWPFTAFPRSQVFHDDRGNTGTPPFNIQSRLRHTSIPAVAEYMVQMVKATNSKRDRTAEVAASASSWAVDPSNIAHQERTKETSDSSQRDSGEDILILAVMFLMKVGMDDRTQFDQILLRDFIWFWGQVPARANSQKASVLPFLQRIGAARSVSGSGTSIGGMVAVGCLFVPAGTGSKTVKQLFINSITVVLTAYATTLPTAYPELGSMIWSPEEFEEGRRTASMGGNFNIGYLKGGDFTSWFHSLIMRLLTTALAGGSRAFYFACGLLNHLYYETNLK